MDSHFASPGRTGSRELSGEISLVSQSPVVTGLLDSVGGLLAVLDGNRQIVAVNDLFLSKIGVDDPSETLGLRPGEALKCIYSDQEATGCGTSKYCSTCGAAVAIVAGLVEDRPVERKCALSCRNNDKEEEIALLVRAHPIEIGGSRFILLFLRDITADEQRVALERTFFHDINNILNSLANAGDILIRENSSEIARTIKMATARLLNEVSLQHSLSIEDPAEYRPEWHEYNLRDIMRELEHFYNEHPSKKGREIVFKGRAPDLRINTDISALLRVLNNMIINALEATEEGGRIRIWIEKRDEFLTFLVWNRPVIPREVAYRVFQRNFSTKEGRGRGLGAYSMKLFGEEVLGGRVSFTSSEEEGTVFIFDHPLR